MNIEVSPATALQKPTSVRYRVLGLACALSMITYLDRACIAQVIDFIQKDFQLTNRDIGWIMGAFLLAYSVFEIPSGWLGDVFGPRKTLIRIVLWWSFFTVLTGLIFPIDGWLRFGFWLLVVVRFCFGIGEAGAYPNIARTFHNWFPFIERGFAQGAVWMSGRFMGGVTPYLVNSMLIAGAMAADGTQTVYWRHTFWMFGCLGVAWCVVCWWWLKDRPEQNPSVNAAELKLIEAGKVIADHHSGVPWKRLVTSGNLWLLCIAYFCSSYGWYFNMFW
ncbi:MAG TPA: MFS transporter, partial [Gemmataceae bacterium]|nr:MFS transporter [Gemmataceae bacterium]